MSETKTKIGVIGTGYLGRLHARVLTEMPEVDVVGFVEPNDATAAEVEEKLKIRRWDSVEQLTEAVECAVVATPTIHHHATAATLLRAGRDVMIEKPITATVEQARELIALASERGRVIQIGHVERYNPAIAAVAPIIDAPRYIEADRLGVFSPRSLDIDVLLDLMIHDLNLVLSLSGRSVKEIRAVGVPVLTDKVDMANVRLELDNGSVANLTASRVSSERVRKLRLFGADYYVSIDTREQDVKAFRLLSDGGARQIVPIEVEVQKKEPLRAELEAFVDCVRNRTTPTVTAEDGLAALELAIRVGKAIEASMESVGKA